MPDLLLELFSEEIPARMQRQAAEDLKRLVTNALVERNLLYEGAQSLRHAAAPDAACRRACRPRKPNLREERKGPRVGAPEAAIQGFLKSAGLSRIEDARGRDRPEEGRVLCRGDREAGPRNEGRDRRDHARDHPRLSVAEIDALGRRLGEARRAALGAPAARNRLHPRHPARYGGDRPVRRSTASRPAT